MEIFKRIALLLILPLSLAGTSLDSWGSTLVSGDAAPNFLVKSGNDQQLSLDMLRGKVVVLFYESRRVTKKNAPLKDELKRLYRDQPRAIQRDIFRLVVIDCAEASWPLSLIWKKKLIENSGKEGFTIYGDWAREMFAAYHMQAEESNFLIIDKCGIIRYSDIGRIPHRKFARIIQLLFSLVRPG